MASSSACSRSCLALPRRSAIFWHASELSSLSHAVVYAWFAPSLSTAPPRPASSAVPRATQPSPEPLVHALRYAVSAAAGFFVMP